MNIITISREFGSGGRELGKKLAIELDFDYYDREIIHEISEKSKMDENYISNMLEAGIVYASPVTYGRTFYYPTAVQSSVTQILSTTGEIIKGIAAKGRSCVIVGRSSDIILEEYKPFNIFVYSSMQSKIARCRERAKPDEHFTDKELEREIKRIDTSRAKHRELLTLEKWGHPSSYHLCVNTTGLDLNDIAQSVARYSRMWFDNFSE